MPSAVTMPTHETPTMPDAVIKRDDEVEAIQKRQKGGTACLFCKHHGREEKWSHARSRKNSK